MSTLSILPAYYDLPFIIEKAGVLNHYGYETKEDGFHFRYLVDDYDAVQAAIASYPTDYVAVMRPGLIHLVSKFRENKVASFSFGGMTIPLNLETVGNLTAAAYGLERNGAVESLEWSLGKGAFVTLPRTTVFALADAAFTFVQGCFKAQKAIVTEIMSAPDIEVLRAINIAEHEAWPA